MEAALLKFFPDLNPGKLAMFEKLEPLYREWNTQINVISRKDMDHFYEHHVLHSLALAFYWKPEPGSKAIDIGTGGGFPGIPLAILYPEVDFLLVDSIGKKIKVVNEVAAALGLTNVKTVQERAENIRGNFDTALTRAVSKLDVLTKYCTQGKLKVKQIYCLKGGDLKEEIEEVDRFPSVVYKLQAKIPGAFFETKKVVCVHLH